MKSNFKMKFAALTVAAACVLASMPVLADDAAAAIPATSIKLTKTKPDATDKWFVGRAASSEALIVKTNATFKPDNADKTVTYTSNNPAVVYINDGSNNLTDAGDASSSLVARAAGVAIITVQTVEGFKTATYTITVPAAVKYISLAQTDVSVVKDKTVKMSTPIISPSNAAVKGVKWSSTTKEAATVNETTGVVTGVAAGETNIIATAADGSGAKATCHVQVYDKITAISLTGTTSSALSPNAYGSTILTLTTTPAGIDPSFTVTSSSPKTVRVESPVYLTERLDAADKVIGYTGEINVNFLGTGKAKITAKSVADPTTKVEFTVNGVIPVSEINLRGNGLYEASGANHYTLELNSGTTTKLTSSVNPSNASMKNIVWTSTSSEYVTVANGSIKGLKDTEGKKAPVTFVSGDNQVSGTIDVTVVKGVTSVAIAGEGTLKASTLTMSALKTSDPSFQKKQTMVLTATVLPADAANNHVYWTATPDGVVDITWNNATTGATLTPLKAGKTVVTATNSESGKKASYTITVPVPVYGVSIVKAVNPVIAQKANLKLTAIVNPSNATTKSVTWTVSSTKGALTLKDATKVHDGSFVASTTATGEAIVTATSDFDPRFFASYKITVLALPTKVEVFNGSATAITKLNLTLVSSAALKVASGASLSAKVTPDSADQTVVWTSSDSTIVSVVSSTGVIVAKKQGVAKITATTKTSGKTGTVEVTVLPKATKIAIPATLSLKLNSNISVTPTFTPTNTGFKGLDWSIEPKADATSLGSITIDGDGKVTQTGGSATGSALAVVTVKTLDGSNLTGTCKINIAD